METVTEAASTPRALIIEDDENIIDLLALHLLDIGIAADTATTGNEGLAKIRNHGYSLIVLDLMLPGMDGLSICRSVRERDPHTPILMVTARSDELDKVLGLELGADDYITKPFSPREFIARVKAVMRRAQDHSESVAADSIGDARGRGERAITVGDVTIDQGRRRVFVKGAEADLTAKEYELLCLLAGHPGQAFNREQLLERVWGYHHEGYNHTVNSHINRLRAKIEPDPAHPQYVETVWGYGYRFAEPQPADGGSERVVRRGKR